MPDRALEDRRILVVEDEYLLASELQRELEDVGAIVLGPAGEVETAIAVIGRESRIDAAVVDLNLRGEPAYPVADVLVERGVPFVLTTGYDASALPPRFAEVTRCEKPVDIARLARALQRAVGG